jgi:uncharacterized protein
MPRPRRNRFLQFDPEILYFKPQSVPLRKLQEVVLQSDEIEALKLYGVDDMDQIEAAREMKISQPTFSRILTSTYKKVADALVNGKAIRVGT